jgi:hypothetical protein
VPVEIARTLDPSVQELLGAFAAPSCAHPLFLTRFPTGPGYSLTDYTLGYASPPRLADAPHPDLIKTHDAAPLGSGGASSPLSSLLPILADTLAPKSSSGGPRGSGQLGGGAQGSSLTDGKLVAEVYEDTAEGDKALKETREVRQSGGARRN